MMARAMPATRARSAVRGLGTPVLRAAALTAVVLLAGCGGRPDPLASGSASPAPSTPRSVAPVPHEVPTLEARLPYSIRGTQLTYRSYTGASFLRTGTSASQAALRRMLADLDRSVDDLTLALAEDPMGSLPFVEGIFRVAGTAPDTLERAWIASQQAVAQGHLLEGTAVIAGMTIHRITDAVGDTTYIVPRGDSLVLIIAGDPAMAEEAVTKIR